MSHPKVALTTFVSGEAYQAWIPFALYSIARSHPSYHAFIFVGEQLAAPIARSVELIAMEWDNFHIIVEPFADIAPMNRFKAQTVRWVLWDKRFLQYDYLYYIDIDILYCRETIPLHEQHIRHMQFLGHDSVSNIVRRKHLSVKNYYDVYLTVKFGGGWNAIRYLFTPSVFRMSGLHFVKVKEYFGRLTPQKLLHYRKRLKNSRIWNLSVCVNDEAVLYEMMRREGFDLSPFAVQRTSATMFGSENPERREFCPHHGIHMALFRGMTGSYQPWELLQLQSGDYARYFKSYLKNYFSDPLFNALLANSSPTVRQKFKLLNQYISSQPQ